jgi:hypothetical protein
LLPDQKEIEEVAEKTRAAVSASSAKPKVALVGRGGVGNWSDSTAEREEEERRMRAELEARIALDVEAGLAMPKKTYHTHDRDME